MLFKILFSTILFFSTFHAYSSDKIVVGSKRFTENYIVAEIFSQLLENHGYEVERRFGLAGTMVTFNALKTNEIQVYPDYTGTITEAVLKTKRLNFKSINQSLAKYGAEILPPLGFDNSYCLVIEKARANQLGVKSISDLKDYPELTGGMSAEFLERSDGWKALATSYRLANNTKGIEVPLTYQAVKNQKVDFAEAYTTEPLIDKLGLMILNDDKDFFPKYSAVALVNSNLNENAKQILRQLSSRIDHDTIVSLNTQVTDGLSIPATANNFLVKSNLIKNQSIKKDRTGFSWAELGQRVKTHIFLTGLAVLLAALIGVPIASLVAGNKEASALVMGFTGILQTIPSIALLSFMIPFFGIGFKPALIGLFIYSLLPIVRNTYTAMNSIDPRLITSARGIGLYSSEIYFTVKLPLAFPTILAGIRTATTLNIGTATLAAFIGAGGLGEPIVTGLALNDSGMILQGAIPAALLALIVDLLFGWIEKSFSKGM